MTMNKISEKNLSKENLKVLNGLIKLKKQWYEEKRNAN